MRENKSQRKKSIFYVKNYPNLSDLFFIEENHFRGRFFIIDQWPKLNLGFDVEPEIGIKPERSEYSFCNIETFHQSSGKEEHVIGLYLDINGTVLI